MGALGRWVLTLDGDARPDPALVGGKAWSIASMQCGGLPVPPAFVATTAACRAWFAAAGALPDGLEEELRAGVAWLEAATGRRFGGARRPLLLAVRSGAAVSMPGMMDTVLNLGIDETVEEALARESGDPVFARDTHRRFCEMYGRTVLKAPIGALPPDGDARSWRAAVAEAGGGALPAEPHAQLAGAVAAVFDSWNGRRARRYRKHHGIADDHGTAVTVQAMVFGNLGAAGGAGVLFSRNPLTGAPEPYGEYLPGAQGEDVVSGARTPLGLEALAASRPAAHRALLSAACQLEHDHRDAQDIEFTVQEGSLFLLQTRTAKRSPAAAVRIAVDLVREGTISKREALTRISAEQVRSLLAPRLADGADGGATLLAQGTGASPGIGVGAVVPDADTAEAWARAGKDVVLVRPTTSPEDVHGMAAARAVVTAAGGATSHAAVVSRAMGRPCVVGCGDAVSQLQTGRRVTVEGRVGRVYDGALPVRVPRETEEPGLREIERWARAEAPLAVYRVDETAPEGAMDLDGTPGGESPERLPALLAGAKGAKGGALASDAGVAAAVGAGLSFIVVQNAIPALLAACAARGRTQDRDGS